LQVVFTLNRGGIETWLVHLLRHIDRQRFRLDFLVHSPDRCDYESEVVALGARVLRCPPPTRLWRHARRVSQVLRESGPYDVVHSHVTFTGYVLRLARGAGVPLRVAHSHNDAPGVRGEGGLLQRVFLRLTSPWVRSAATHGLAASRLAATALFGPRWHEDPRWRVFHCGVDLAPFEQPVDAAAVRRGLGVPPGAPVVGHVGRFFRQKNHDFLMDVAAELARREPRARLLLIGDGPLRPTVERKAARLGLRETVLFAGTRPDVPCLMRGAMDAFVLPSLYEGLPLVGIEAQAAGLPCVLSDTITPEVDAVPALVRRLPLARGAPAWAEALRACLTRPPAVTQEEALGVLRGGPFNVRNGARALERFYDEHLVSCGGAVPGP
jgi:glycosyltransferase involved in cell wall biosynthesis